LDAPADRAGALSAVPRNRQIGEIANKPSAAGRGLDDDKMKAAP